MEKKAWRIMMKTLYAAVSPEERRVLSAGICRVLGTAFGLETPGASDGQSWPSSMTKPDARRGAMLAAFHPRLDEPDVRPFLAEWLNVGGRLCLPKCITGEDGMPALLFCEVGNLETEVHIGTHGLREPVSEAAVVAFSDISVVLVPGIAFDLAGGRLGRGKGYYDRFLASVPHAVSLAPAFPWQMVDSVPLEPHDVRVALLAGAEGLICCKKEWQD